MASESQDETHSLESYLATVEKTFEDSLAHYTQNRNAQAFQALREAQTRLMFYRLAAGLPISDLLPRLQQALAQFRPQK